MTTHTSAQARRIWQDTCTIVSTAKPLRPRQAHTEQSRPAMKSQAEKEADRWVAEMMFDHYNG